MKRKDLEQTKRFRTGKGKLKDTGMLERGPPGSMQMEPKVIGFGGHS